MDHKEKPPESGEPNSDTSTNESTESTSPKSSKDEQVATCSTSKKRKNKQLHTSCNRRANVTSPVAGPSTSQSSHTQCNSSPSAEREVCPVCRKKLGRKPIAIPDCCNHSYCYECIKAWVTKAKSNCPMDRKEIKYLKIFENDHLISKEPVEHKVTEEEELAPDDEGEICPDCGWIGMRPSLGVCQHCSFHHDHPWPVEDCPQCMETESNDSDEEWDPSQSHHSRFSESSQDGNEQNGNDTDVEISDSDHEDDEESAEENQQPSATVTTRRAPVRRAPARRRTQRRTTRKRKRKTTSRRKTTTKRKVKRTTTRRRTSGTARRVTGTARRVRRTTKGGVKKRRKVSTKSRRLNRRRLAPSDAARIRLAKLLGLRPPKDPRQTIPRGCKPRPVTSAQIAAAAPSTSNMVTARPIGSLSYHNQALPPLHLFGGDELVYFPSDSDSDHGEGGSVSLRFPRLARSSEVRMTRQLFRQKGIHVPILPSDTPDVLESILQSQSLMLTPFDIRPDGSIQHSKNTENSTPIPQTPRLNVNGFSVSSLISQRPGSQPVEGSRTTNPSSTVTSQSSSTQPVDSVNNQDSHDTQSPPSHCPSQSYQHCTNTTATGVANTNSSHETQEREEEDMLDMQDKEEEDDDEIDLYDDIPSSNPPRVAEDSSTAQVLAKSPSLSQEPFDSSLASYVSNESEGECEEENERMIIDETDPACQSPQSVPSNSSVSVKSASFTVEQNTSQSYNNDNCPELIPSKSGNQSPCYGGGSPAYKAADSEEDAQPRSDVFPNFTTLPSDVCPNLFTYSAASLDIARSFSNEEEDLKVHDCAEEQREIDSSANYRRTVSESASGVRNEVGFKNKKITSKSKRRQSLVEEIFGSDVEDCVPDRNDSIFLPIEPTASAHMTGLEGLDTETISETEEDANFNDFVEVDGNTKLPTHTTAKPINASKNEADYEEGEIVEDRPKGKKKDPIETTPTPLEPDSAKVENSNIATSPVSPDPSPIEDCATFENLRPPSPEAQAERPPSRHNLSSARKRNSKPRSPERKRSKDEKSKKSSKATDSGKASTGNIEWKKLSKSTKERNYRDGKAKENVRYDRNEKRSKSSRDDRRSRKKKEKRKDLERYDVRKVINERSRRDAERRRRDQFGRDISREHTHSRSHSRSPRPLSHHQPRHRRRSPDVDHSTTKNRSRRHRRESWSSARSHISPSGSSRGSSPHYAHTYHSSNTHHRRNYSRDNEHHKGRDKSVTPSPTRSLPRDLPRLSRRERSCSFSRAAPGLVTIVTGHDRLTTTSHAISTGHMKDTTTLAATINSNVKKKNEKVKEKIKKTSKKKKKEHHRHVLAPLTPAGSSTNNNPTRLAANISTLTSQEKKKRKREKSPPASKEVFASGDNILVSVNFNKPTTVTPVPIIPTNSKPTKDTNTSLLPSINNSSSLSVTKRLVKVPPPNRDDLRARNISKRPKRDVPRKPAHIPLSSERSPKHKTSEPPRMLVQEKCQAPPPPPPPPSSSGPANRRREENMKRRKRIAAEIAAKRKPVAIIDLESSPFAERAPSPAEIITLSDGESSRMSSSSQCSDRSSIDGRRDIKRGNKDDRSRKQRSIVKSDGKNTDRPISMCTTINTTPTVILGPKTPPEPQIKFSINAKPQLRSILNPLQDEDDDIDIDTANGITIAPRDKAELDVTISSNSGVCAVNSGIPTLLSLPLSSIPPMLRGPNTPPEPCLSQSRSSSCSTTTKLDIEPSKSSGHTPQSPVDVKSPDAYDPFEPTKSPSDASSSEQQHELCEANADSLSQVHESAADTGNFTPGSMSDNSVHSPRHKAHTPQSPSIDGTEQSKLSVHESDDDKREEIAKKIDAASMTTHSNIAQVEDQPSSPPSIPSAPIAESSDVPEMKPTSTTVVFPPPLVAAAQGLITTLPPTVANILCAPQHQGLFRPPLAATIATVPFLLSAPSLLGLRVSQQNLLATSQQSSVVQQQQQNQQQQPDTTTTTDVVDMDLESPYSPASSEGDDLFEPPDKPPSPAYPPRKEKVHLKPSIRTSSHQKRSTDKFDLLFNQSVLKKEVSSTSGNRNSVHQSARGNHVHRISSKGHHNKADNKSSKVAVAQKTRGKIGTTDKNKSGKKEISIKMDEDQLKILDDLPSSAVEMQVKEKYLKKLNRQERVVEEVKLALKPHYTKKMVNKEEYKEILRRAVPKICHNKTGEINPIRIRLLVSEYVKKFRYMKKKDPSKLRGKADKQR